MTDRDMPEEMDELQKQETEQRRTEGEGLQEPVYVEGESDLDDVFENHPLVLVDFFADWCGPCEMIEPVVERLSVETDVTVAKVDVDENQALAQQHGVRSIPALLLVRDGEIVEQMTGVQEEDHLRSLIDQYSSDSVDA